MEKYLGESIPKLGFGLMRLPMKDGGVDLEQTTEMVDMFMKAGFRYIILMCTGLRMWKKCMN